MVPSVGVSGIVNSIAGKMSLFSKQIRNILGFSINPVAKFQPTMQWSRFTLPIAANVVSPPVCHVQPTIKHRILRLVEILRALICGFVWILSAMFSSSYIFAGLCVPRDDVHSERSLLLAGVGEHEGTHFIEDIADGTFQPHQWCYCCKSGAYKAYRCLSDGKLTCLPF
jgi:hypothetical protein